MNNKPSKHNAPEQNARTKEQKQTHREITLQHHPATSNHITSTHNSLRLHTRHPLATASSLPSNTNPKVPPNTAYPTHSAKQPQSTHNSSNELPDVPMDVICVRMSVDGEHRNRVLTTTNIGLY
ncbi:hypothetical protein CVT25_002781 [Psilocybe cyanescens]|uniref:Uncharacterized protein n=1 Tax=Psilocybe cyanescens TaxID=93625 RepID=A0A409WKY1_PSICY|nr:hypothetical protein CVT25_002781 [Psilocybe cyanescens]